MRSGRRWVLGVAAAGAALVFARGPLHRATYALPTSNDDAIPLLIARHVLGGEHSTVLWNQPYNGTLDAYLLAPVLVVLSPHSAFRAYEALCAAGLVALSGILAWRAFGSGAGWAAALLAAIGSPYMALMGATGPTPNFLVPVLVGAVVAIAGEALGGRRLASGAWLGAGLLAGLAVWDSVLAVPALAGAILGLVMAGLRPRPAVTARFTMSAAVGLAPLAAARLLGASASSPVTEVRPRWLWADGTAHLAHAAAGLLGLEVPLVIDGPERAVLAAPLRIALGLGLGGLVAAGLRSRRALPFAGWAAALSAAFVLSRRTGPDEVRYLFGLALPVIVLAGGGFVRLWRSRPAVAAAAALAVALPWTVGHRLLVRAWREPAHASRVWQVPSLDPLLDTCRRAGVESAYASLQFAGRLTLESGEEVIASQAWNERVPGDPLRFRDEVDLDPNAAWVLSPHLSRGMPRAGRFRELLGDMGGGWKEDLPGEVVMFRRFRPPYDEARPVPKASVSVATLDGTVLPAAATDRDPGTGWTAPVGIARGTGLVVRAHPPRTLAALVLLVDLEVTPLGAPWVVEVEGRTVAQGPAPHTLQWVNGVPRAGRQALMAVPLAGAPGGEVRLLFQGPGPPLRLAEVFLYGPDEVALAADGAEAARSALQRARAGDWDAAAALYGDAVRREPHRASHHAALARSLWRASRRRRVDVESLDDGGPALVGARPAAAVGSSADRGASARAGP